MVRRADTTDDGGGPVRPAATISDVRRRNERLLMRLLRVEPGLANVTLSHRSGLAPQTVSVIMTDLKARGLVVEGAPKKGQRGSPARPNHIVAGAAYALGLEVGWQHADAVLVDLKGNVLSSDTRAYAFPDPFSLVGELAEMMHGLMSGLPADRHERIAGLGVAMPDGIGSHIAREIGDRQKGAAWQKLDLAERLIAETGQPVCIYNDGTAACLTEYDYGAGRELSDFVHLFVATYVGAGIVTGGQILAGPTGNAANLGAMMAAVGGGAPRPIHNIAGLDALNAKRAVAGAGPMSQAGPDAGWKSAEVACWLDEAGQALALTIANTRAVIEYDVAIIDGTLPPTVRDALIARVCAHLEKLPHLHVAWPQVRAGGIGAKAPALGAATGILDRFYFGQVLESKPATLRK